MTDVEKMIAKLEELIEALAVDVCWLKDEKEELQSRIEMLENQMDDSDEDVDHGRFHR